MTSLDDQLAGLATMSPAQLRAEWVRVYRADPPDFTPDLLRRGIAYRLQEKRYGGLATATKRQLAAIAAAKTGGHAAPAALRIKTGTRLSREWQGRMHHVLLRDDGVLYQDQHFASLTAVAKRITGGGWSGPRFFGLTVKRGSK